MKKLTRLVAIIGADGAGKSTLSKEVIVRLNELGHSSRRVDRWDIVNNAAYPSARFLKSDVPDIRSCVADMPPTSRFLFLLWSMSMALSADVRDGSCDEFVLLDGYWMKHAASEVAYGLTREWVTAVSSGLPPADIVLYLRLAAEEAWSRKQEDLVPYECGMDASCSKEGFLRHQKSILLLLDDWSRMFGWIEINASDSIASIADQAVERILARIHRLALEGG